MAANLIDNLPVCDPIIALESLGYTEREAGFLYLVAAHSGYFLRRQFDYFIDRNKGSIAMRLLEKGQTAGHIEFLDYKQGWRVYHLFSRTIYRLLGHPESQLRRRKGDAQVRARLMALDYVLENDSDHFLSSERERTRFFTETRRVARELFEEQLHPLLAAFPISVTDRTRPSQSTIRFAFIDEGFSTTEKFLRFLFVAEPLLRAVGDFEVVYVAGSEFNFHAATTAFWNRFVSSSSGHLRLFDEDARSVTRQLRVPLQAQFTTLLFRYSYPALQQSEAKGSERVRA